MNASFEQALNVLKKRASAVVVLRELSSKYMSMETLHERSYCEDVKKTGSKVTIQW